MRVEIGDGRESVEEGLAVVTSTTLKQLRESSDVVESPRGHSVSIGTCPTCEQALSDGPNAVPLKHMRALLENLQALDAVTKRNGYLEDQFSV